MLVIADEAGAVGLAGIMGGAAHRGISATRAMCFWKSAFFAPEAILGRARRLGS